MSLPVTARVLPDLEALLQQLATEHRRLLALLEAQQEAMRRIDLAAMDVARNQQEACRLRITAAENKRRLLVGQMAKLLRQEPAALTLSKLAELHPHRREPLLKVRAELTELASGIARRTHIAGKLAGAMLGHLNTVVRLLAGAVEKAGIYTKAGVPRVSARIGVMEAVG